MFFLYSVLRESDFGGPLALNNHLIGILSWGNHAYPYGFIRISAYFDWIQNTMAKNKF